MSQLNQSAWQEWKSGWPIVLSSMAGISLGTLHIYSVGLFIQPLELEFGWSRSEVTSGLTIVSFIGVLLAPYVGSLIDKWGARRIAIPGTFLFCSAIALLSVANGSIWSWWALWTFCAFTALLLKPTVWSVAISGKFTAGRGVALAVALCGTGIGATFVPLVVENLMVNFGWRWAFFGLGAIFLAFAAPLLLMFFEDSRHVDAAKKRAAGEAPVEVTGWTVKEGLAKRQFYQLCIAAFLNTLVVVGFLVHLVPMMVENDMSRASAVKLVGTIGLLSIIGRLTVGFMLDRMHGPVIGMVSALLPAIAGTIFLMSPGSPTTGLIVVFFLGLAVGGEYDAIIYLSTRYFGLRKFGSLFGYTASCLAAGVGLGPLVGGMIHDAAGDYRYFLLGLIIPGSLLAGVMLGSLGRYPVHAVTRKSADEGAVAPTSG